jgi:hypothetical protein
MAALACQGLCPCRGPAGPLGLLGGFCGFLVGVGGAEAIRSQLVGLPGGAGDLLLSFWDPRHDAEHLSAVGALEQNPFVPRVGRLGGDLRAALGTANGSAGSSAHRVLSRLCHVPFPVIAGRRLTVQPRWEKCTPPGVILLRPR